MKLSIKLLFIISSSFIWLVTTGLNFEPSKIPLEEIHGGGPPKDGIPALIDPTFITAKEAKYLKPYDRIIGLEINGIAKAYPLRILTWHELVNDMFDKKPALISFCPLCGTAVVFDPLIKGKRLLFGVSGKLYNSNILFYDKKTQSLWSQGAMEAVTGDFMGTQLDMIPSSHTTWRQWKKQHPKTLVLSPKTGYERDYNRNPYSNYAQISNIYFPVNNEDNRLNRKDWVAGIILEGKAKAYPLKEISRATNFKDTFNNIELFFEYNLENESLSIKDSSGNDVAFMPAYWFAWVAFYPNTEIWTE